MRIQTLQVWQHLAGQCFTFHELLKNRHQRKNMKDQIRTEKLQTRVRRTFVFDFSIGTVQTQGNAVISAMVRFAIFFRMRSEVKLSLYFGGLGVERCSFDAAFMFATVRNRPQPPAMRLLWPCPHSTLNCLHCLHTPHFTLHPVPHSAVYSATGTGEKIQGC